MKTLITSAAYVENELAAEIGMLPPSFLPLGNERLISHQVAALRQNEGDAIYISLPESFVLDAMDMELLDTLGVKCIRVPDNIQLGSSILHCISQMDAEGELRILHGDTLFEGGEIPYASDCWLVSQKASPYHWGVAYTKGSQVQGVGERRDKHLLGDADDNVCDQILVGYFAFSDAKLLAASLIYSNGDFLTGLARYAAVNAVTAVVSNSWKDFGHLQTFFEARSRFASARSFNSLQIENGAVRKSSNQSQKLAAEASWLNDIPAHLKVFTGRLLDSGPVEGGGYQYTTEYEAMPTLQELFVFGRPNQQLWQQLIESCVSCLQAFSSERSEQPSEGTLTQLGISKTRSRLDQAETEMSINLSAPASLNGVDLPSVRKIAAQMYGIVAEAPERRANVMHGDFCFSNIMYNSRLGRVRLIDPRGTIDGETVTIMGDIRYDMAKLAHSVIGRYDLIIAGRFNLSHRLEEKLEFHLELPGYTIDDNHEEMFWKMGVDGISFGEPVVKALLVLLFMSMLPLHSDRPKRQLAFLANALRLYKEHFLELS